MLAISYGVEHSVDNKGPRSLSRQASVRASGGRGSADQLTTVLGCSEHMVLDIKNYLGVGSTPLILNMMY